MLRSIPLFAILIFSLPLFSQNNPTAITGRYLSQDGKGKIEIHKSGNQYFGNIYWLKEPTDINTGKAKSDKKNPDPEKRNRLIVGLVILEKLQYNKANKWENGKIYDPNTGKTWDCDATLIADKLKLTGYWKTTIFGRTEIWTRIN